MNGGETTRRGSEHHPAAWMRVCVCVCQGGEALLSCCVVLACRVDVRGWAIPALPHGLAVCATRALC